MTTGDPICARCGQYLALHKDRVPCHIYSINFNLLVLENHPPYFQLMGDCTPGDYPLTTDSWNYYNKDKPMKNKALVFGATGQDGFYLVKLLLEKDYEVVAVRRRSATNNAIHLEEFKEHDNFTLVTGDVTDYSSILNLIQDNKPDEIYNLAAQSHVGISFEQPQLTWEVTGKGCMNILEAIRFLHNDNILVNGYKPKFYQASTSEMFGDNYTGGLQSDLKGIVDYNDKTARYQDENTACNPQSTYAVAQLAAHH